MDTTEELKHSESELARLRGELVGADVAGIMRVSREMKAHEARIRELRPAIARAEAEAAERAREEGARAKVEQERARDAAQTARRRAIEQPTEEDEQLMLAYVEGIRNLLATAAQMTARRAERTRHLREGPALTLLDAQAGTHTSRTPRPFPVDFVWLLAENGAATFEEWLQREGRLHGIINEKQEAQNV